MKAAAFLSVLSALATLFLLTSAANANPRIPDMEVHAQLVHEEVDIKIEGEVATVSGVYQFKNDARDFVNLQIYLPVYAKKGTPEKEMRPQFKMGDKYELDARFIKAEWEKQDPNIRSFGELPQLEGQRVYWFLVPYLAQQPGQKEFTLKITYKQKLSNGKFIYTPLIPKQKKDHDYGNITISGDRPVSLVDEDKHEFAQEESRLVVKPHNKRAVVVKATKVNSQLP